MELLTIEEAATKLSVSARFLKRAISRNEIEHIRLGGKTIRLTEAAIKSYIQAKTVSLPQRLDPSAIPALEKIYREKRSLKSEEMVRGCNDRLSKELKELCR